MISSTLGILGPNNLSFELEFNENLTTCHVPRVVSNPDPSLSRSAGCIASPARGRKGLATLARFSCAFGMQLIQRCGKGRGLDSRLTTFNFAEVELRPTKILGIRARAVGARRGHSSFKHDHPCNSRT